MVKAIILIVAVVAVLVFSDYSLKRAVRRRMARRPRLTDEEFARFFPPDHAQVAAKVRMLLARHATVDLARITPSDGLADDLRIDDLDSMATVEFLLDLENEFRITIGDEDAQEMRTVEDVVRWVAAKTANRKGATQPLRP